MSFGMNLHHIVRGAINAVNPDVTVQILRSMGSKPDESGFAVPVFQRSYDVRAQIQSEGDAALFHADMAGANTVTRRIYLYTPKDRDEQPAGVWRPLARSGDYIVQEDNTVWLINAVIENFAGVNWLCVRATLQVDPPEGVEYGECC